MSELERLDSAIAGVLGWHIDDSEMPAAVREEHNTVITAARAYRDLLANGQRVEWCEEHGASVVGALGGCGFDALTDCRLVSRLLSVYPKEAENE